MTAFIVRAHNRRMRDGRIIRVPAHIRGGPEAHHVMLSNHEMGRAMDISVPRPLSGYRTREEQRELLHNWLLNANFLRLLPATVTRELLRPIPNEHAQLVAWGGGKRSIQVGSSEDRKRERARELRARVRHAHEHFNHVHVAAVRRGKPLSPAQSGLLAMGRELDLIWP